MRLLVINGPNLNLLGIREPELYGKQGYRALEDMIRETCRDLNIEVNIIQSNHEGVLVDAIQGALGTADAILINPAAYTHTSIAILDALKAVALPAVEVHLTQVEKREEFRRVSYAGLACERTISGLGFEGYAEGIRYLKEKYDREYSATPATVSIKEGTK